MIGPSLSTVTLVCFVCRRASCTLLAWARLPSSDNGGFPRVSSVRDVGTKLVAYLLLALFKRGCLTLGVIPVPPQKEPHCSLASAAFLATGKSSTVGRPCIFCSFPSTNMRHCSASWPRKMCSHLNGRNVCVAVSECPSPWARSPCAKCAGVACCTTSSASGSFGTWASRS